MERKYREAKQALTAASRRVDALSAELAKAQAVQQGAGAAEVAAGASGEEPAAAENAALRAALAAKTEEVFDTCCLFAACFDARGVAFIVLLIFFLSVFALIAFFSFYL